MFTSVTTEPSMFSLCDYQGGREAPADTEKSKEQLYTEAKEILALVGGRTPTESPNNTGPRRPPRSKHDSHVTSDMMPSSEAASRMLIGTMMLNKQGSQSQPSPASVEMLKKERNKLLEEVNKTTKELSELSIALEEAERSVDLEQSLIGAELSGKQAEMQDLENLMRDLRQKEALLGIQLDERKLKNGTEIKKAKERLEAAEKALDELEAKQSDDMSTDEEMELLEKIKKSHESLEVERRVFEDLEFRQMEEEASLEAEIEDICRDINETKESFDAAEISVSDMTHERMEMNINQDISIMQEKKDNVSRKLEHEKEKLADLEVKLRQMLVNTRGERSSEDSGTINWSETESESKPVSSVWAENNLNNYSMVESVHSSTSDLTKTPSPHTAVRGVMFSGVTPQQRAGIPTPKYNPMEDSLVMSDSSRPVSVGSALWPADVTDTSSWVGGVIRRDRASSRAGQRPLTRYLPVSNQMDFDLRSHIETAGHQVSDKIIKLNLL